VPVWEGLAVLGFSVLGFSGLCYCCGWVVHICCGVFLVLAKGVLDSDSPLPAVEAEVPTARILDIVLK
jgi:hypothetical protein